MEDTHENDRNYICYHIFKNIFMKKIEILYFNIFFSLVSLLSAYWALPTKGRQSNLY